MAKRTSKAANLAGELMNPRLSGRQVERFGEFDLWPGPQDEPIGELTEELIDRAFAVRKLTGELRAHADAALVMFLRGEYPMAPSKVRKAFGSSLASIAKTLDRSGQRGIIGAEITAAKLVDHGRRDRGFRGYSDRLRRTGHGRSTGERINGPLHRLYTNLLLILDGGSAKSRHALVEMLQAAGVEAAATEKVPGRGPLVSSLPLDQIAAVLSELSLKGIANIKKSATDEDWAMARDDVAAFVSFARLFTPFAQTQFGAEEAFGFRAMAEIGERGAAFAIPGMMVVRRMFPEGVAEWRGTIEEMTPMLWSVRPDLERASIEM